MSVQIIDPPDSSVFPYDEGWTATATYGTNDEVSGVLMDYKPDGSAFAYPTPGASGNGPDANGVYTWQVPFQPDATVQIGDSLVIYCYDAETFSNGSSVEDIASQNGGAGFGPRAPGGSTIVINAPTLKNKTFQGTVKWPAGTPKGGVFLVLANLRGDIGKHTRRILVCCLNPTAAGGPPAQNYKFDDIDDTKWTHIHVVAATYKHQISCPAVYQFKPPPPAPKPAGPPKKDR